MRSVKLPFKKSSSASSSNASSTASIPSPPLQPQSREPNFYNTPEPTVVTTSVHAMPQSSFAETLRVISKEANRTQFDDVFDSFFFNDKRCQHRALFMAARLKQTLDGVINPIRPSSNYGPLRELPPVTLTPSYSTPITSSTPSQSAASPATTTKPIASVDSFWRTVTHRLYTLNYILFVLPADSQSRADFLNKIEADLSQKSDGRELQRRGGMEAHFAVRYALEHKRPRRRKTLLEDAFAEEKRNGGSVAGAILPATATTSDDTRKIDRLVEQARLVIEQCLESESKLGHAEKDAMYVFHGVRAGLHGAFDLHIELEEDRSLRHRLKRTVDHNRELAKPAYENPFEDEDLIVTEEDESSLEEEKKSSREVDSGFYDGWANSSNQNAMLSA
ncbi:hypothetical protein MUCCIDRAFT_154905 [Mucor lusitanicus CBS 277.49]|uniref:Uncharacterized protein n=2 Tax=Mucor circinelloides f. lusitanicus TaxID=29924 RepID=A0A168PX51_MUCCL|nr:hypothetical protein MUCCIDRAFT_154905 [Mucor lusitanicus CBS 277.49]